MFRFRISTNPAQAMVEETTGNPAVRPWDGYRPASGPSKPLHKAGKIICMLSIERNDASVFIISRRVP